jgi:hypothetical protein
MTYYRGEVYDPFYGNTLSDQDFTNKFEDHVNSFFDAMQRTNDKRIISLSAGSNPLLISFFIR